MKKKRFPKKWYVYVFESITEEWIIIYKIGCTKHKDATPRLKYANKTYGYRFSIKYICTATDMYKEENDLLWYLRSIHCCILPYAELFFDCEENILSYFYKKNATMIYKTS